MDALEAILTRRSVSKLVEPGPNAVQLETMLNAAVHAPDHKELAPWRFLIIDDDARHALGEVMAEALRAREPGATPGQLDKQRQLPLRAPTIIVASAKAVETNLPFSELTAATSAAVQNILLAAHALGLGAIWRTGNPARDPHVKAALGVGDQDEIVGFVYVGTPVASPDDRNPTTAGVVSVWSS